MIFWIFMVFLTKNLSYVMRKEFLKYLLYDPDVQWYQKIDSEKCFFFSLFKSYKSTSSQQLSSFDNLSRISVFIWPYFYVLVSTFPPTYDKFFSVKFNFWKDDYLPYLHLLYIISNKNEMKNALS